MTQALWTPSAEAIESAQVTKFVTATGRSDYSDLYQWSIDQPALFWRAVWDYCGVVSSVDTGPVVEDVHLMPGARWFPEARLNFAENLLRKRDDSQALVQLLENGERRSLTYAEL